MKPIHSIYLDTETLVFPNAITLKVLLSGSQTNGKHAVFEDIVEPGIGPARHIHHNQDEIFFFLDDNFIVEVAGQLHEVSKGDVCFIPRGTVHAFKNKGSKPGRLRYIFTPALSIEEMFREFHAQVVNGILTGDTMSLIALQHGQEFVGPPL